MQRQRLVRPAPAGSALEVLADMAGAQAQLESAAAASLAARVESFTARHVSEALWQRRAIAKANCMRRTLHLVPSAELALFVRGTAGRAKKEIRWMLNRGVPERALHRALDASLAAMDAPVTRGELADRVARSLRAARGRRVGGGWGSTRHVATVRIGPIDTPAHYLLHLVGAVGVVCYGPPRDNEPTFVRADAWVPGWTDVGPREAEDLLLRRYLRAFGPATARDFAAWTGVRLSDARAVWGRAARDLAPVDVEGTSAWLFAEDLALLRSADLARPHVRLLPYFDAYLLGHENRDAFVPDRHKGDVYRKQGWVAPVVLVDGRAAGTWSNERRASRLEVRVEPFTTLSRAVRRALETQAQGLARFHGCPDVTVTIAG